MPDQIDVKSIRTRLKMTQAPFSDTFGFSLDAIKHWEGGAGRPSASPHSSDSDRQESCCGDFCA